MPKIILKNYLCLYCTINYDLLFSLPKISFLEYLSSISVPLTLLLLFRPNQSLDADSLMVLQSYQAVFCHVRLCSIKCHCSPNLPSLHLLLRVRQTKQNLKFLMEILNHLK